MEEKNAQGNKTPEKSHKRLVTKLIAVVLILAGAGMIIGMLAAAFNSEDFVMLIAIGLVIGIPLVLSGIKTYKSAQKICPKCGRRMNNKGLYRESGEYEVSSSDTGATIRTTNQYLYECPHCHTRELISKKDKVASYKYK